jgi:hypothetical protein
MTTKMSHKASEIDGFAATKPMADRLAQLLASEDGSRAIAFMQQLASSLEPPPAVIPAIGGGDLIGIWQRSGTSLDNRGFYERSEAHRAEWRLWADVPRIQARKTGRRILFAGESVARGYFYDPHYNPAQVLATLLHGSAGLQDVEVVDVARSDIYPERLRETISSALRWEPDLLVVFAGNNWCHGKLRNRADARALRDVAGLLRAGHGFDHVKARLEEAARAEVLDLVGFLGDISRSVCPVVMVVPEFNLVDWETAAPAPWLKAGGGPEAAEACSMSGAGQWRLGKQQWLLGNCEAALDLLTAARDTTIIDPNPANPRVYSVTQATLRESCPENGVHVVDLPSVFRHHSPGRLPDRRMFHDYSHLTDEGIRVAMAATAARIAQVLAKVDWPSAGAWSALERMAPRPPPRVVAESHFMAAIHNAHLGQGHEICLYHADQALQGEPELATAMVDYVDSAIRHAPAQMCASFGRLCRSSVAMERYLMAYTSPQFKISERVLIQAFGEALERHDQGAQKAAIVDVLVEEHGMRGAVDLLRPECHATCHTARELFDQTWLVVHFRARSPRSLFTLVCDRPTAVTLKLTLRAPLSRPFSRAEVMVNDATAIAIDCHPKWTTQVVVLPAGGIRRGANDIVIRWPEPEGDFDVGAKGLADDIELGLGCDPYPVLGEIHTFVASPASAVIEETTSCPP